MNVLLENKDYDWETMTLIDFLIEGNIPTSYQDFFIKHHEELETISEKLSNSTTTIYPPIHQVFRALYLTPLNKNQSRNNRYGPIPQRFGSRISILRKSRKSYKSIST